MTKEKHDAILVGVQGELDFNNDAFEQGLVCSRPFSDYRSYDFIVDSHGFMNRVQVKAKSEAKYGATYIFSVKPHATDFDVLACKCGHKGPWYLIPRAHLTEAPKGGLHVTIDIESDKMARYWEDWALLKG